MRPNTHDEKRLLGGRKAEDQSRRRSVMMIAAGWALAFGLLSFSLLLLTHGARRLFLTGNPQFTLKNLEIVAAMKGDKLVLTDVEGLEESLSQNIKNFEKGRVNLFNLDVAAIREVTMKLPATRSCIVERILPDTLRISIFEKRPVARVISEGGPMLCSLDGMILPKSDGNFDSLPTIQPGKTADGKIPRFSPGSEVQDPAVLSALRYLRHSSTWWREFDGSKVFPESLFTPTFIRVSPDGLKLLVQVDAKPDCRLEKGVTLHLNNSSPVEMELSVKRAVDWVLHNRDEGGKIVTEYIEATMKATAGK
ncbi:MAG: hypothetical protein RL095_2665 [Verrucomicrobiota bacterium]|jgi:cell division septal protein FtsQ